MNFINPKTDFAFKKIFGSPESKNILISFLNALVYDCQPIIEDLEIIDPYQAPKIKGVKDTYLDVKAKITGDKTVIIEMQVLNVESFEKRILYNAAKAYAIQLPTGKSYQQLNPVIALTITDFEMFENIDNYISHFVFKEKNLLVDYPSETLEMIFVELPKFYKVLDELETIADKWIYFLKTARILNSVPQTLGAVPEIQQAFQIANQANLNYEELDDLARREIFIQDQINAISKATKTGIIQGIQQGLQQGIQQGIQQGVQQGKQELILSLLEQSLGEITPDIKTRIRELSVQELDSLGKAIFNLKTVEDLKVWLNNIAFLK